MSYSYDDVKLANRANWFFNKVSSIPNKKLDWITKGVVIGISQQYVERSVPHSQVMKLWYQGIEEYSGLSSDSIGKSIAKLKKANAAVAEQKPERRKDGVTVRPMWFCFTPEFLTEPALLFQDVQESNHGGTRVRKHKGCGGLIVNLCTGCGETHIPEDDVYYEDEQEPEGTPDELARLDAQIETYEATATLADMPRDDPTREQEAETFRRAMKVAQTTNGTMEAF